MDRRAAEQLEQALATGRPPATTTASGRRTAELLDVATMLRTLPGPAGPAAAFRTELRERLEAEACLLAAARAGVPQQRREPAPTGRVGHHRRVLAGTVAAVLVSGTAAAVASTNALPGDVLYPVKRSMEDVRASVGGDAARGAAALDAARERLDEAEALVLRSGSGDSDDARDVLVEFGASARAGSSLLLGQYAADGDPAHLLEIQEFVVESGRRLARVRTEAPEDLYPTIDTLIALMRDLGGDLGRTLAACGEPCARAGLTGAELAFDEPADGGPATVTSGSTGSVTAGEGQVPAQSTISGVPAAPTAAPAGGVEIADGSGAGAGDAGVVASVPAVTGTVPLSTATPTVVVETVAPLAPLPGLSPQPLPAPTVPGPILDGEPGGLGTGG